MLPPRRDGVGVDESFLPRKLCVGVKYEGLSGFHRGLAIVVGDVDIVDCCCLHNLPWPPNSWYFCDGCGNMT